MKIEGVRRFTRGRAVTEILLTIADDQIVDMDDAQIKMKVNAMLVPYLVDARKRAREAKDAMGWVIEGIGRDARTCSMRDDEEI